MEIGIALIVLYIIYVILSFAELYYVDKRIKVLARIIEILVVLLIFISFRF